MTRKIDLFDQLDRYPNRIALQSDSGEQLTYRQLVDLGKDINKFIKNRCLIFLVCNNCVEAIVGYVAFMRVKSVVVMINDSIRAEQLIGLIQKYKPKYLFSPISQNTLEKKFETVCSFRNYSLVRTYYDADYPIYEHLALLLSTSGSTGSAKFVRLSHSNLLSNARSITQYLNISERDRTITTMPMSYSYGLSIINSHLLQGASIIVTELSLMEKRFWELVVANDVTSFGGVPFMYEVLTKLRFDKMKLPSLRYITQAGGSLGTKNSIRYAEICAEKNIEFFVMYGQTEATARIAYLPARNALNKAGSIGIAIPGGKIWLEDKSGDNVNISASSGDLVYQGDNVSLGYSTGHLDLANGDDNGGILHTGDIARRDSDGFFYVTGRRSRFIKIYGNRVNLDEVDQLIRSLNYDAVCAGTDDGLIIYVTHAVDSNYLARYVSRQIRINQTGISVVQIDKIPRDKSGKILYANIN